MRISSLLFLSSFVVVLSACSSTVPVEQATSVKVSTGGTTQTVNTAMPIGVQTLPGHGQEVGMAYGAVSGVDRFITNGVVNAHYLKDGSTTIGLQMNIEVPADGYFYEGWIEKADGSLLSLGHLTNPFNDVRHGTRFQSEEDLRSATKIRITLEKDDGNPAAGTDVATAILKPTSR